jgi:hypothetical protein
MYSTIVRHGVQKTSGISQNRLEIVYQHIEADTCNLYGVDEQLIPC